MMLTQHYTLRDDDVAYLAALLDSLDDRQDYTHRRPCARLVSATRASAAHYASRRTPNVRGPHHQHLP